MKRRLTIDEQRIIAHRKLQKLKVKFLTKEQSAIVHLVDMTDYWWLLNKHDLWASGFTRFYGILRNNKIEKINLVYIYIRLYYEHEDLKELLDTFAEEFAHVYLTFNDPEYGSHNYHGKKWEEKKEEFLEYLLTN